MQHKLHSHARVDESVQVDVKSWPAGTKSVAAVASQINLHSAEKSAQSWFQKHAHVWGVTAIDT